MLVLSVCSRVECKGRRTFCLDSPAFRVLSCKVPIVRLKTMAVSTKDPIALRVNCGFARVAI